MRDSVKRFVARAGAAALLLPPFTGGRGVSCRSRFARGGEVFFNGNTAAECGFAYEASDQRDDSLCTGAASSGDSISPSPPIPFSH